MFNSFVCRFGNAGNDVSTCSTNQRRSHKTSCSPARELPDQTQMAMLNIASAHNSEPPKNPKKRIIVLFTKVIGSIDSGEILFGQNVKSANSLLSFASNFIVLHTIR